MYLRLPMMPRASRRSRPKRLFAIIFCHRFPTRIALNYIIIHPFNLLLPIITSAALLQIYRTFSRRVYGAGRSVEIIVFFRRIIFSLRAQYESSVRKMAINNLDTKNRPDCLWCAGEDARIRVALLSFNLHNTYT